MFNPKRYSVDTFNGGLEEDIEGDIVYHEDFVNVMAVAIESEAGRDLLSRQVPDLKKALIEILVLAAQSNDDQAKAIKEIATKALSQ